LSNLLQLNGSDPCPLFSGKELLSSRAFFSKETEMIWKSS
jgi:hypothetical protein